MMTVPGWGDVIVDKRKNRQKLLHLPRSYDSTGRLFAWRPDASLRADRFAIDAEHTRTLIPEAIQRYLGCDHLTGLLAWTRIEVICKLYSLQPICVLRGAVRCRAINVLSICFAETVVSIGYRDGLGKCGIGVKEVNDLVN
jgi:hypothetical protein